jgi:pimeloyl-ACP methyl ester carboxylesterase
VRSFHCEISWRYLQMNAQRKETGHATVNGLKMYYEIRGSGRPLVLLHGGGSTIMSTFGRILPELAKTRQVIAVELQAHGHTPAVRNELCAPCQRLIQIDDSSLLVTACFAECFQLGRSESVFLLCLRFSREGFLEVVDRGRVISIEQPFHAGVEPRVTLLITLLFGIR